ncbi:hypothetical protein [uncultured Nostoc sp.]|uniref:hypothetical protein n=1 Tax=uncultured Nostoc sp. TaxID=340711 RepID=UPI002632D761|nr:hypothetical protein [uncultured Nostoc sp.]
MSKVATAFKHQPNRRNILSLAATVASNLPLPCVLLLKAQMSLSLVRRQNELDAYSLPFS